MQPKQKQKRCKVCKTLFMPRNTLQVVCSPGCALDHAQGIKAKEFKKQSAQKKREFLDGDLKFQKAKAQKAFNAFIRERDKDLPCISCEKGKNWDGQWHAGHYKTVGARPDLRFNEFNCHKQCSVCNNYLSGNLAAYRAELINRVGIDKVLELESDSKGCTPMRATDYAAISKFYTEKLKALRSPAAPQRGNS